MKRAEDTLSEKFARVMGYIGWGIVLVALWAALFWIIWGVYHGTRHAIFWLAAIGIVVTAAAIVGLSRIYRRAWQRGYEAGVLAQRLDYWERHPTARDAAGQEVWLSPPVAPLNADTDPRCSPYLPDAGKTGREHLEERWGSQYPSIS
jgi:hypothetical protein